MAHKKKPQYIAELIPLPQYDPGEIPPNTTRIKNVPGWHIDPVWLISTSPKIMVIGRLTGKPEPATPKPRYETIARPGVTGATRYLGHDPHEMAIPMMLDKGGDAGVEKTIGNLERLMQRTSSGEPPVVRVQGVGVPHTDFKWRVQDIEWNPDLSRYLTDGRRERFAFTLHLLEHVADRQLAQSLTGGKGLKGKRRVMAHKGETLSDVSRRIYGDPSHASDLQKANPWTRMGMVFTKNIRIYAP